MNLPHQLTGRKHKSQLKQINGVIGQVVASLGLDRRLKENTFMNLWPVLMGQPWANNSRSLYMDNEGNLVVSVANASVAQELSLMKLQILKKLRPAAQALGLKLSGLRFDLKRFHEVGSSSCSIDLPLSPTYEAIDLSQIELSEADQQQVKDFQLEIKSVSPNSEGLNQAEPVNTWAQKVVDLFEKELRLRAWYREKNYPQCKRCEALTARLYASQELCALCFYELKAQ